jgi:NAD(P)-dependent dehydrogenase (short-subunit alcohol dehydrogenase family)
MEMISKLRFADSVVVVSGSARGIGRNIARAFGAEGARVAICDIDQEQGRSTEAEFRQQGIAADFFCVDLSQRGEPQAMIRQSANKYGRLDVLVNNAVSGSKRLELLEEDEDTWDQGMSVTLKATYFASQEAIRVMSQAGGGKIVNISSVAGLLVCSESPHYHIAKAGLLQMTRYLAANAGRYGICVNAVLPGFIVQDEHRERYAGNDNQRYREIAEFCHPLGQVGTSDDIAKAVMFLCSSDASFLTGQCLIVDGGLILQEQSGLVSQFNKVLVDLE